MFSIGKRHNVERNLIGGSFCRKMLKHVQIMTVKNMPKAGTQENMHS